nr:MAG TPA: hypothetical protein [Caudoviricetes sp.]
MAKIEQLYHNILKTSQKVRNKKLIFLLKMYCKM